MEAKNLQRGNEIVEQLKKLESNKKALELDGNADTRRMSLHLEGRQNKDETWKTLGCETVAGIIGVDVFTNAVNVARVLILEAVTKKEAELKKEFEAL